MKTHVTKAGDITREWWVIDAEGVVLGRLASEVAKLLKGKHKPTYSPHLDTGDHVIIVNAGKVVMTGNKITAKKMYRHSGYQGGLTAVPYEKLMATRPELAVEKAVKGMLPHTRLGTAMGKKLKVYAGPEHGHSAQKPKPFDVHGVADPKNIEQAHTIEEVTHGA
jgi:large subunit ribosomal protein L13